MAPNSRGSVGLMPLLAVLAPATVGCIEKTGDTGIIDPDGEVWEPSPLVYEVSEYHCDVAPSPRVGAMAAWFRSDDPLRFGSERVDRGVLYLGGLDGNGQRMDDMWVFNLSAWTQESGDCPWIHVTDDATEFGGVMGGALVFDPEMMLGEPGFALVGGEVDEGNRVRTSGAVDLMALSDLDSGGRFSQRMGALPPNTYAMLTVQDQRCAEPQAEPCFEFDMYTGQCLGFRDLVDVDPCTGTSIDGTCDLTGPTQTWAGCSGDLSCTDPDLDFPVAEGGAYDGDPYDVEFHEAPGLSLFAWLYDPIAGATHGMSMFGGATGCNAAGACPEWADLASVHASTGFSTRMAASDQEIDITLNPADFVGRSTMSTHAMLSGGAAETWPSAATAGFSSWSAASLDATFMYERGFIDFSGTPVLVGGSPHQTLLPAAKRELTEVLHNECGHDWFIHPDAEWSSLDMVDYIQDRDGSGYIELADGGRLDPFHASVLGEVVNAAVLNVEAHAYLVMGGRTATEPLGTTGVYLFEQGGGFVHDHMSNPRYGMAVAFDPTTLTVFGFGGTHDPDAADVVEVAHGLSMDGIANTLTHGNDSPSNPTLIEYNLQGSGQTMLWQATTEFPVELDCSTLRPGDEALPEWLQGSGCLVRAIHLSVPVAVSDQWSNATIKVTDASGEEYELEGREVGEPVMRGQHVATRTFLLPRAFRDGDELTVSVRWHQFATPRSGRFDSGSPVMVSQDTFGAPQATYLPYASAGSCAGTAYRLSGLPAWPSTLSGPFDVVEDSDEWANWQLRVVTPPGQRGSLTAFAPSERVDCADTDRVSPPTGIEQDGAEHCFSGGWPWSTADQWVSVVEHMEQVPGVDPARQFWVDSCVQPAARILLEDYVVANAPADMDRVRDHLGPDVSVRGDTLFVPRFPAVSANGQASRHGTEWLFSLTADGRLRDVHATRAGLGSVFTHEFAHDRWGGGRYAAVSETHWVMEAIPSLMQNIAYPKEMRFRHWQALAMFDRFRANEGRTSLEGYERTGDSAIPYFIGSYALAQARALMMRPELTGWPDAPTAAAHVDDLWLNASQAVPYTADPFNVSDVQIALQTALPTTPFYAEWIALNRVGTPLLALDVDVDPDYGDLTYSVKQIQHEVYADHQWPIFTHVPYLLGCEHVERPGEVTFAECRASLSELIDGGMDVVGDRATGVSATDRVPFQPGPQAQGDLDSVITGLMSGDQLIPAPHTGAGVVWPMTHPEATIDDDEAARAPWRDLALLRCAASSDAIECDPVYDNDFDGFPELADCDDGSANIAPNIEDVEWTILDRNCDTYPREGWR